MHDPLGLIVLLIVGAVLAFLYIIGLAARVTPASPTPEQLDQEAARHRAQTRALEALADLERAKAQLRDQRNFFKKNGLGGPNA
jgi:hypothetical protein